MPAVKKQFQETKYIFFFAVQYYKLDGVAPNDNRPSPN